jgi:hypothetical protein
MGISRKTALVRIVGLARQIDSHLAKIRAKPHSLDVDHWRHEVRVFVTQIEDLRRHLGGRTAELWRARVDEWLGSEFL